jgi:hypothetical protein
METQTRSKVFASRVATHTRTGGRLMFGRGRRSAVFHAFLRAPHPPSFFHQSSGPGQVRTVAGWAAATRLDRRLRPIWAKRPIGTPAASHFQP